MERIFQESTLLRFKWDGDWIRFKVRNRCERWGHTFLCDRKKLLCWLQGQTSIFLEMDGYRLLKATQIPGQVTLTFFWFDVHGDGRLAGSVDTVHLDKEAFLAQLLADTPGKMFSHLHKFDSPTRFDFSTAQNTLRKVIADKRTRRALCRALAQRVGGYCGDHVQVYNDYGKSFYLITTTPWNSQYNGGLILHSSQKEGREYVYYGFHT